MRTRVAVVAMLLACSSGKDKDATGPKPPAGTVAVATGSPDVPKVERASLLAVDDGKPPPLLVVIDDPRPPAPNEKAHEMKVLVAFARSWAELAKQAPEKTAKQATIDLADKVAREAVALGTPPEQMWNAWERSPVDLVRDDPPPPEEEDKPDDGEDESGGTGRAMALEEGKMGKKDSDRAEGQYRMKRPSDAPALPKASPRAERGPLLRMPPAKPEWDDGNPARLADVAGEVKPDGKLDPQHLAILATPRTNAQRLALAIAASAGAVVVAHAGTVRPLHIDFTHHRDATIPATRWVEVRVAKQGFAVEAVPDTPLDAADASQLAAAIDKARALRKLPADAPVDLLVDADANAQRLVDLLVALDAAGVRSVGIGAAPAPGSDEAKRRGHRNPTVVLGQPNAQGDLDKPLIRRVVRDAQPKLLACYTGALARQPELAGTVQTQFAITPKGKVKLANAAGVDPAVAACIAGVIKKLEFPKPKGGGMVQVNYPLLLRP